MNNPFSLVTASNMTAEEAVELWCDDKRLDRVISRESCFIHGHRGTGKSMLFRVLQRDCQELLSPDDDPTFLAVYFPVRDSDFLAEELEYFQTDHQKYIFSESQLSLLLLRQLFLIIRDRKDVIPAGLQNEFIHLISRRLNAAYRFSTASGPDVATNDFRAAVIRILENLDDECLRIMQFICRRLYGPEEPFDGPLFLFDTLLAPIADFLLDKVGVCLFFLIDDGDDLPISHTVILNTWIARRRKSTVFKVTTMYRYRTWQTRSGAAIQQPHDFIHYDIATRYLEGKSEDYVELLRQICSKRLGKSGILDVNGDPVEPTAFFPPSAAQQLAIEKLTVELTKQYERQYQGRAVQDNVYRHKTSEYMKYLKHRRSLDSYYYAGFRTLAILSGGLVRDFIVSAQRMFDDAHRDWDEGEAWQIPPGIQNQVMRDHADRILSEIRDSRQKRMQNVEDWRKIGNLIEGLGSLFKKKMLSTDSERRVFSFAFQTAPNDDIVRLLSLAISEGYFIKGFISKKEGTGRRVLYVLTRRLAPAFSLDVSAYSGYLSCTPDFVSMLMETGDNTRFPESNSEQLELFEVGNGSNGRPLWLDPPGLEEW